jgi:hypothetical protein
VNKLEISPDKQFIAAAGNPHIRFFEVNTHNPNPVCYIIQKEILQKASLIEGN